MSFLRRTLNFFKAKGVFHALTNHTLKAPLNTQISSKIKLPLPSISALSIINNSNSWIYQENERISNPLSKNQANININDSLWTQIPLEKDVATPLLDIEAPTTTENIVEKYATRMIVQRRKKMKKHKLRKLRRKMKFEWAKRRQKRELKKEKEFQAKLIAQYTEAEAFDAEKYVQERLDKLHEIKVPMYYKGKRMPEFLIREKLGLPPKPKT